MKLWPSLLLNGHRYKPLKHRVTLVIDVSVSVSAELTPMMPLFVHEKAKTFIKFGKEFTKLTHKP